MIEWAAPDTRSGLPWGDIARELRANPGEWACVGRSVPVSWASMIRSGDLAAIKPRFGFEVRTSNNSRATTPRTCDLYLRYLPEKDEEV